MPNYLAKHFRSLSPPLKSGPAIADHHFVADNDSVAISIVQSQFMDGFDRSTDTIYLWNGTDLVWGEGLKG